MNIKKVLFYSIFILSLFVPLSCTMEPESVIPENDTNIDNNNPDPEKPDNPDPEQPITPSKGNIPREYWGTWIRMDTGSEYYIDSNSVYEKYSDSKYPIQNNINGFSIESDSILQQHKDNSLYRYFKKAGKNRSFQLKVSGFADEKTALTRGPSLGFQNIIGRRENENNSSDTQTVKPNPDGTLDFSGAISDDEQKITIEDEDNSIKQEITVNPNFDGEDMGTIPIIPENEFGFKITYYKEDRDNNFYTCSNDGYYIYLNITNVGYRKSELATLEIINSNPYLKILNNPDTLIGELDPGKSQSILLKITYTKPINLFGNTEFEDCSLNLKITEHSMEETAKNKVWLDQVSFRFYKGSIPLKLNCKSPNGSDYVSVFVIYPNGKSYKYESKGYEETINLPWSKENYTLVFSGPSSDYATAYSFCIGDKSKLEVFPEHDDNYYINLRGTYEPNDIINAATKVINFNEPVISYLRTHDIDFYTINIKDLPIAQSSRSEYEVQNPSVTDNESDYEVSNSDGKLNPGEKFDISFDILANLATGVIFPNMKATISCSSPFITIPEQSRTIDLGNLSKSMYDIRFKNLSVSEKTPLRSDVEFTVVVTDGFNQKQTVLLKTYVKKRNESIITPVSFDFTDDSSINPSINNNNNKINLNETIKMEFQLYSDLKEDLMNLDGILTTSSPYITITDGEFFEWRKSFYPNRTEKDHIYFTSREDKLNEKIDFSQKTVEAKLEYPITLTVHEDAPVRTNIPLTLIFTSSNKQQWTVNYNIQIEDTVPPKEVTDLTIVGKDGNAIMNWTNPSDDDFNGVEITYVCDNITSEPIVLSKDNTSYIIPDLTNEKEYQIYINTIDIFGNKSTGTTTSNKIIPQSSYNIELTPSTTNIVRDFNISVGVNNNKTISMVKWGKGEKKCSYFEKYGNKATNVNNKYQFPISENGIYTVFVKTTDGIMNVETINITNIDRVAPSEVSNLMVKIIDGNRADVSFIIPEDKDFKETEIQIKNKDGSSLPLVTLDKSKNTCTITGLDSKNSDYFIIKTRDNLGNVSTGLSNLIIFEFKLTNSPTFIETKEYEYHVRGNRGWVTKEFDIIKFGDYPQSLYKGNPLLLKPCINVNEWYDCYTDANDNYYVRKPEDGGYYKIEPIKWTVLTDNYGGKVGHKLLFATNVLDFVRYNSEYNLNNGSHSISTTYYDISEVRAYLNGLSYEYYYDRDMNFMKTSTKYLNCGFLQKAFSPDAITKINDTFVDNSIDQNDYYYYKDKKHDFDFYSQDTTDKIFLLSLLETTNYEYGFDYLFGRDFYSINYDMKYRPQTDYAQGEPILGTRSAQFYIQNVCCYYYYLQNYYQEDSVSMPRDHPLHESIGIAPALTISCGY